MSNPLEASAATNSRAASQTATVVSQLRRTPACADPRRPPINAPIKKAPKEVAERAMENPDVPATAKPRKTTFPVMFAVKTPNPRTLTASTIPVTRLRIRSTARKLVSARSALSGDDTIRSYVELYMAKQSQPSAQSPDLLSTQVRARLRRLSANECSTQK